VGVGLVAGLLLAGVAVGVRAGFELGESVSSGGLGSIAGAANMNWYVTKETAKHTHKTKTIIIRLFTVIRWLIVCQTIKIFHKSLQYVSCDQIW
jgi:hypothetical protein